MVRVFPNPNPKPTSHRLRKGLRIRRSTVKNQRDSKKNTRNWLGLETLTVFTPKTDQIKRIESDVQVPRRVLGPNPSQKNTKGAESTS